MRERGRKAVFGLGELDGAEFRREASNETAPHRTLNAAVSAIGAPALQGRFELDPTARLLAI